MAINPNVIDGGGAGAIVDPTNPNWTPINPMTGMTAAEAAAAQATGTVTGGAENYYFSEAKARYGYIDSIFATDDELKKLLIYAISNNLSDAQFQAQLTSTQWYIKNAGTLQARGFSRRQYEELIKNLNPSDPDYANKVKAVAGNTDYARGLDTTKASLQQQLNTKGIEYTEADLNSWSKDLYDGANEKNTAYISRYLNTKIGAGSLTKGTGATNLEDLADYASSQGMVFDKDFTKAQQTTWIQRMDAGESLAAIKKEIETAAMIGESEAVQNLMRQGLTRSTIYQPLVNRANSKLQRVDMTMNDEWLQKNAKDEKGNLRPVWQIDEALMKHPDWEFTDEAQEKVGDVTLRILRDFGFQG
jgi:hypothetical protein